MARTVLSFTHGVADFPAEPVTASIRVLLRRIATWLNGAAGGAKDVTALRISRGAVAASGTITLSTCPAGTVVRVNGVPFRAISGSTNNASYGEFAIGGTDTADAANLVTVINASTDSRISGVVTATSALGVVTVTEVTAGAAGGCVTLDVAGILASGTITAASVQAADTFTINGVTLTSRQEMARGTITLSGVTAGQTVTVNGVVFTAIAGTTSAGRSFAIGGTDTEDATELKNCINADPVLSLILTASSAAGVVSLRAIAPGTAANAYTLTKSGAGISVSGATLSGGQARSATTWDYGDTNAQAAAEIGRCINSATNTLVADHVTANVNAAVVTVVSKDTGLQGNTITLASSDGTRLAVTGARLTGGTIASSDGAQATQTVTISGADGGAYAIVVNGVSIAFTGTNGNDTTTAASGAAAVNSSTNALVRGLVTATSAAGVVTLTAVRGGLSGNMITLAASGTGATADGTRLAGGAVPTAVALSAARLSGGSNGTLTTYTI